MTAIAPCLSSTGLLTLQSPTDLRSRLVHLLTCARALTTYGTGLRSHLTSLLTYDHALIAYWSHSRFDHLLVALTLSGCAYLHYCRLDRAFLHYCRPVHDYILIADWPTTLLSTDRLSRCWLGSCARRRRPLLIHMCLNRAHTMIVLVSTCPTDHETHLV